MNKIRKGDQVVVLSGRDKGRQGAVIQVLADDRVLVESVNMAKRHTKAEPAGRQAGRHHREGSAAAAVEGRDLESGHQEGRPRRLQDARRTASKVRFFKSNGEMLDA